MSIVALRRCCPLVDTLPISLETTKLVGEYIRAEANLKLKIRDHGRRSWIPRDRAAGGCSNTLGERWPVGARALPSAADGREARPPSTQAKAKWSTATMTHP